MDIPLSSEIGQCRGGRTRFVFTVMTPALEEKLEAGIWNEEQDRPLIDLFSVCQVGQALASAFAPLPFAVTVVDICERRYRSRSRQKLQDDPRTWTVSGISSMSVLVL